MVLLKELFKEACDKFGYNDFYEMELYFSTNDDDKAKYRKTILRRRIDDKGGVEFLRQQKMMGKTVDEVAEDLNCSVNGIYSYLRPYDLTWKQLSPYTIIRAGSDKNGKKIYWLKRVSDNMRVKTSTDKDLLTRLMNELMMEE